MRKTIYKNLIFISLSLIILLSFILNTNYKLKANETLKINDSLINKQNLISQNIFDEIDLSQPQIILDPYDISPLTALIIFESSEIVSPTITIKAKENQEDLTYTFDKNKVHYLPIYGLYPDYNNEVIVEYNNEKLTFNIQTKPLPEDFPTLAQKPYLDDNYQHIINNDFYFLTPAADGYTCAYDKYGNVRWYLLENLVWEIKYLNNDNLILSSERLINPPYYTTGFYEMSLLGKIEKEYISAGGYHHDIFELVNGNFLVASNDFENDTVEDVIVEIDRDSGEIIKTIDLKEILNMNTGKSESWVSYDWFHNNSVFYDEKTNSILLSGRHQDIVVNLDYDTLKINYIIGNPDKHHPDYQQYFLTPTNDLEWPYSQHAAKFLPNGDIFIFDNGNNRAKNKDDYIKAKDNYSRGVIYRINQKTMEISQIYEYGKARGSDYYSPYISDVDYLNNNHYLIHSGGHATNNKEVLNVPPGLAEFDSLKSYTTEIYQDTKIFELIVNTNNYRAEKMPIYKSRKNHNFDPAIKLGTFNETETKKSFKPFINLKESELLNDYAIDIIKEDDRLAISGNFNKDDEVNIVLYQNSRALSYEVRITDRPYTAMCIVVFDDKKQNVTKYINDSDNLVGTYSILIKINGNYFNTSYNVTY